jgi:hypothetical protein
MNANFRVITLMLVLMLSSMVCSPLSQSPSVEQQVSATPLGPTSVIPTVTESGSTSLEATATESQPTAAGAQCTILQDLNLRSGPGTAYRPPLAVIPANTVVTPTGYSPTGRPGGSWVLVQDPVSQKEGWVSAGAAYVNCNLDLTTLPAVAVAPPNPPTPHAESSNEDGTCNSGETYDCAVVLSDESLVQFKVLKDGQEIGENDGVDNVSFTVTKDGESVYSHVENNAPYCIFGGNGPCNPWVFEDDVYKWENDGAVVEAGQYHVDITATVIDSEGNTPNLHWEADVAVTLP